MGGFDEFQGRKENKGQNFEFFISIFLQELPNKFHNSKPSWVAFLHFEDLVSEGQILNFYRHFIYDNFIMNFKISGFVGFAGWIYNLDSIKVTGT